MHNIYLDHNSTTPLHPRVLEAMLPYLTEHHGNPSTGHWSGRAARAGLDRAREQVARSLGCEPDEIVFTGGSSEASNLVIKGLAWSQPQRRHLVYSKVEHAAVRRACQWLEEQGWSTSQVAVSPLGGVTEESLQSALRDDTLMLCLMGAQNEVGTLMPVARAAALAHERGALMFCDASQAAGKVPFDVRELDVDVAVVAAHKFYGPKGVGAAYVRRGLELTSLVHGVGHEGGRRAGTENVAGIVGLGAALELAVAELAERTHHVATLRDRLWNALKVNCEGVLRQGDPAACLPNTLLVCFEGVSSTELLARIPELAASTGAACQWGVTEPSATLTAMGVPREVALGAVRFSLGVFNTLEEVEHIARRVAVEATALRAGEPARA